MAFGADRLEETVALVEDAIYHFVTAVRELERSESVVEDLRTAVNGLDRTGRGDENSPNEAETNVHLVSGALVLFNAAVLYGVLARQHGELRPLHRRARGEDRDWKRAMGSAVDDALDVTDYSTFIVAKPVLEAIPATPESETALERLHEAAETALERRELLRHDLTGRVYHAALERTRAKNYAACYTKLPAGELLAWLGIADWDANVGEFACGSGTLVTASYHRKLYLATESGMGDESGVGVEDESGVGQESDARDEIVVGTDDLTSRGDGDRRAGASDLHQQFVEEDLWGLDAMRFPAYLTTVNLAFQRPDVPFEGTNVYHVPVTSDGDPRLGSLALLDSSTVSVQPLPGDEGAGAGSGTRPDSPLELEVRVPKGEFDLVIMNPPFTRTDRAAEILDSSKLNAILNEEFPERDYANTTRSGLAAPFTILGDEAVKPGGRLALVVPSGLLSRETWHPVRDFLDRNYHLEHVVTSWAEGEPAFSENSDFREVLVVARKLDPDDERRSDERPNGEHGTRVTHLDEAVDLAQARQVGAELTDGIDPEQITVRRPRAHQLTDEGTRLGTVNVVSSAVTERTADNWYRLVAFREGDLLRLMLAVEGVLGAAHAPYGIALPDAFSTFDEIADSVNLFMKNKRTAGYAYADEEVAGGDPVVVSARYGRLGAEADSDRWVYRDPSLEVTEPFEYGTGHLLVMRKTNVWATMRVGAIGSVDGSRFAGSSWIPIEMPSDLTTSDGEPIAPEEAARVVATWLNSTFGMVPYLGYRAETEGAYGEWKINQVRRSTALDPSKLTREQVDGLLDVFEAHREREWALLRTQLEEARDGAAPPRRQLDEDVADVVFEDEGRVEDEIPSESVDLEGLYADLYETLELLGDVMA